MKLKGHLTRRGNGLYLLTYGEPVFANVGTTDARDAYVPPGDAIGLNNICPWFVRIMWGIVDLPALESRRVWVEGGVIE